MGKYSDPKNVQNTGRRLSGSTYGELTRQLQPGEKLVGVYSRVVFDLAPHLYSEAEFHEFEDQYNNGQIVHRYGFFAVKE